MIRLILVYPFFPLEHGENVFIKYAAYVKNWCLERS